MFLLLAAASLLSGALGATNCYGDINNLHPTGISGRGVAGSHADVDYRINEINSMKTCYDQVANEYCIESAIIGGIASRETNGGASLDPNGYGTWDPNGYGLLQCDIYSSGLPCTSCGPKTCCHVRMMVRDKIIPDINWAKSSFPGWPIERQVQAAVAAYNSGRSRVHDWPSIDQGTTGRDYSNDVMARAQQLKNRWGWS